MIAHSKLMEDTNTDKFFVRHYHNDPERLIVVFTSLGFAAVAGTIEEFRKTLDRLGVSCVFVTDRGANWYNNAETDGIFRHLAEICAHYDFVSCVGTSSGGSGAIMFSNYFTDIDRTLAFGPQYSVSAPYRLFDNDITLSVVNGLDAFYNMEFSACTNKDRIFLLYGNKFWRDLIHASFFEAAGFQTLYVDGSAHAVAGFLKYLGDEDRLTPLMAALCDRHAPFDAATIRSCLGPTYTTEKYRLDSCDMFSDAHINFRAPASVDAPPRGILLSRGCQANQSSVSPWSASQDPAEDAGRGVDGDLSRAFAFHTGAEDAPWWEIDLGAVHRVREVRIFNRYDTVEIAARSACFEMLTRADVEAEWRVVFRREGHLPIGVHGEPFIWIAYRRLDARFVRFRLPRGGQLHYRQVEVYGDPSLP